MFCQFLKIALLLLTAKIYEKVINEDNKIDDRIEYLNKSVNCIYINNHSNKEFTDCKRKCNLFESKVVIVTVSYSTNDFEN